MNRVRITPGMTHDLLEGMKKEAVSYLQIMETTGASLNAVRTWVQAARADKLVHIGKWGDDIVGRPVVPLFRFGNKPDAARPTPRTAAERMRATRERRRADAC